MEKQRSPVRWSLRTRISQRAERTFFFYATMAMLLLWGAMKILGD